MYSAKYSAFVSHGCEPVPPLLPSGPGGVETTVIIGVVVAVATVILILLILAVVFTVLVCLKHKTTSESETGGTSSYT